MTTLTLNKSPTELVATQNGHGWTGLLILKGTYDISPLYKLALEQSGDYTLVYGDSQHGTMDFRELAAKTPRAEAIAHIAQKLPIKAFSLLVCGDVPTTVHVPTRNTTVALWTQGQVTPGFNNMIETLIQLNREPVLEKVNYAKTVKEKVFDVQNGKYAVCLGYFSKHPRIILSTRNMEIYAWITYYNGVYVFVWSTDKEYMNRVKATLEPIKQNELFYMDIDITNKALLVIHPLFWITKFNKVMSSIKGGATRLVITSYFRNYLLRQNLAVDDLYNNS